ncbi:homoserine dehydrogenase [Acidovorax sp. GBBC 3334]|uniref:homoserine dehydrogenase n=1 Tax=Acidovorax sp. GBBC 3334 TaxID=2940496 RepID=UPI002302E46D|nr:homoserine dehydrogenase [Acidovorax sp. GBBC 3334]MDA8454968.1 homoserine dehydrogenase [Acidovorax sp. GBBC 3334]
MFNDPQWRPLPSTAAPALAGGAAIPRPLRVGMIGIGTVGLGTWRVLARNQAAIAARAGRGIEIVAVAARDLQRAARVLGPEAAGVQLTDDPMHVATHPGVDVLVEVAGGTGAARDWVAAAIAHGKPVVTANKALLAVHGNALFAQAEARGVPLAYEAAVAGGVPVIKALREGATANRVEWVAGIVNGTSNYILGRMHHGRLPFGDALAEAQALGYAEADPAFDVDGIDAAHKTALLAANAFGTPVGFDRAHVEGIRHLDALDVAAARAWGHAVKLLGIARRQGEAVQLRVHPALVPATHLLAQVDGGMNAVLVRGDAQGITMHCGAGAGAEPTASAVVADLVDVARQTVAQAGGPARCAVPPLGCPTAALVDRPVVPMDDVVTRHFLRIPLRVPVPQGAGGTALAALAAAFAHAGIGAERMEVWQPPTAAGQEVPAPQLLALTRAARDGAVRAVAASRIDGAAGPATHLRVETLD